MKTTKHSRIGVVVLKPEIKIMTECGNGVYRRRSKSERVIPSLSCYLTNFPRRKRTKRKFKDHKALSKPEERIDSNDQKAFSCPKGRLDSNDHRAISELIERQVINDLKVLSKLKERPVINDLKVLSKQKERLDSNDHRAISELKERKVFNSQKVLSKQKERPDSNDHEAIGIPKERQHSNYPKALSKQKEKLDSGVFDEYLEKIWKSVSEDRKRSFAYFDSLWFSLYRRASSKEKVLAWIKREHIFSKTYVFVPIVCWGHWSLLIFCNFGESLQSTTRSRCMLLLDSLEMTNPRRLEPEIRKFVLDIYKAGDRPETKNLISRIPFLVPKVPQQRDGNECGNFVLYFIYLLLKCAPDNFSVEGYPYFMKKDWFTYEDLDSFLRDLTY